MRQKNCSEKCFAILSLICQKPPVTDWWNVAERNIASWFLSMLRNFPYSKAELAFSHQLVSEMPCISEHIKNPLIFNETGGKFLTFYIWIISSIFHNKPIFPFLIYISFFDI